MKAAMSRESSAGSSRPAGPNEARAAPLNFHQRPVAIESAATRDEYTAVRGRDEPGRVSAVERLAALASAPLMGSRWIFPRHFDHAFELLVNEGGSGGLDGDTRANLDLASADHVARPDPHDSPPVGRRGQRRDGFDVIRERGAVARRRERKRKREPIGFRRDVIVEHGRAGQALTAQAGKALHRGSAAHDASGREPQRWLHAAVAIGSGKPVDEKAAPHDQLPAEKRSVERDSKRQRPHAVRRNARQRPPLPDRLAGARKIELLQIAQAAVDGAQMVERGAAAEIVALDQRHRETALRRIVGDRQPADPAADDEHVECGGGEPIEITNHGCPEAFAFQL